MEVSRRSLLRAGTLTGAALLGIGGTLGAQQLEADRHRGAHGPLPYYTGPAATIHDGRTTPPQHQDVRVVWSGPTDRPRIALTFDDGPMPDWTPQVLTALAECDVPATFFLRGDHVTAHADLLAPYAGRHEYANHTWDHTDLARLDYDGCADQLVRAGHAIAQHLGTRPTLMRPPYGHIAGSTLLACNDLGLTPVLWNLQMIESSFTADPDGLVGYIAANASPGAIILAHDTGSRDRLVCIDHLTAIIGGLQDAGLELVTVSELLSPAA
ncbi:hypothetical protein AGMMS50218_17300 [Actinomycetota bacterium]|nr:hypothetical protein AGMMS50218_17300 [Actinomycetota bacterium]